MAGRRSRKVTIDALKRKGLLMSGGDPSLVATFQTTGIPQLDEIMSGGVPFNRFTEIFAQWSAGKTLLSQIIAAQFQRDGHTVCLIDTEQSYDETWWAKTGVITDELYVSQPPSGEDAIEVMAALTGEVGLIILDSVAAVIPLALQEELVEQSMPGRRAQLISRMFQKVMPKMKGSGTAIILINQTRNAFGKGNYEILPGGVTQQYFAAEMIRLRRMRFIEVGDEKTGFIMGIHVTKNKMGPAQGKIELPFSFEGGFDFVELLVSDAIDRELITRAGAWYRMPPELAPGDTSELRVIEDTGEVQVMGKGALLDLYKADEDARQRLETATYAAAVEGGFAE